MLLCLDKKSIIMKKALFFPLIIFIAVQLNAVQYHTISGGATPNWSYTKGGVDCNCADPVLGVDSIFIHHSITASGNSRTYNPGSYLYVDDGGVVTISANNASRTIESEIVVAEGGEINAPNGFTITIENTGSFILNAGGLFEFGQNGTFVNRGNLFLDGQIIGCVNAEIHFEGISSVVINGTLSLCNNAVITNETSIYGVGVITYKSGTFINSNGGNINGCESCDLTSPVNLGSIGASGEISNVTVRRKGVWNNGLPDATKHAVVLDTLLVTSNIESITLNVGSLGRVTIASGFSIETADSVTNSGVVTIENSASLIQTGSLSQNSGEGLFIVEKDGTQDIMKYNMWSSPTPGQNITEVFPLANLYDVFVFDATVQNWKYDFATLNPENETGTPYSFSASNLIANADGVMSDGVGYFVPGNNTSGTREFTSQAVNNGTIPTSVFAPGITSSNWSGTDWNLLGNPYPSNIGASSFLSHNSTQLVNVVHLWHNDSSAYLSYNDSDPLMLTSCQGFWVQANADATIEFTNAMRSHSSTSILRFGTPSAGEVYLKLKAADFIDRTRLYLSPLADDGLDNLFDASKMQNPNGTNFYSLIDSGEYVFQSVTPPSIVEDKRIPLAVEHHTDTTLSISADSVSAGSPYRFFLHDKKRSKVTELKKGVEVEFDYEQGSDQYRFELLVKLSDNEAPVEGVEEDLNPQLISSTGRFEILNSTPRRIKAARVYDLSGREVVLLQNIESGDVRQTPQLKSGIFIVRFEYDNGEIEAEKVYVK